jgi:hypothetical protein
MATRYWVGGSGTWDGTTTTNWSASSGGAGGASAPTSADDVIFNSLSNAIAYTVTISGGATVCRSITVAGPLTGNVTFSGTTSWSVYGSFTLPASGITWSYTGTITFASTTTGNTITTNGVSLSAISFAGVGGYWTLGSSLTSTGAITVTNGTFDTGNYAVTATTLSSSNSNTRTINLGSSTVTLSGATPIDFTTSTNLTFNAGTSFISSNSATVTFNGGGKTFYAVQFIAPAISSGSITGANTFDSLTINGRNTSGISIITFGANQSTVNGFSVGGANSNATCRLFIKSDVFGTQRTITCASSISALDTDFQDIVIAGAAAPVSGTRLGDCKGNSGITFGAGKTVYWVQGNGNISTVNGFATSSGGTGATNNFALAQDTAVFDNSSGGSGLNVVINANYNIGTINMSARTSNTMTLGTGTTTPAIYSNWINGTGTTISGTGTLTFAGRGSQTITSAGVTFTQSITVDTPNGSVTLQDAFTTNRSNGGALTLNSGTINANNYNLTLSGSGSSFVSTNSNIRTIAIGSGTWTIAGSATSNVGWNTSTSTNLTVTGTGTISLTSSTAKNFQGGGIQTWPTLNQGGSGALTITGSNKFANITNTVQPATVTFPASTTNTFTNFSLSGTSGNLITINSSTSGTRATVSKSSGTVSVNYLSIQDSAATGGASWYAGANSTNVSNNTGWIFTAPPSGNMSNFFMFF